ncbi:hypothetical protein H0H93_012666 [Arthromyces matolae]|nr:hypothetical protein H0H93_012666 [Arthromyces matolae]
MPQQQHPIFSWDTRPILPEDSGGALASSYQAANPSVSVPFDLELYRHMAVDDEHISRLSSSGQVLYDNTGVLGSGNVAIGQQVTEPDRFDALGLPSLSQGLVGGDVGAMWSNPPLGFELDDWGAYLSNFSDLTHGMSPGKS